MNTTTPHHDATAAAKLRRSIAPIEGLLTTREAAKLLGVTENAMRHWRRSKRLPLAYIRIGRSVRYRRSDIAEFIEVHRITG